jgi:hypothetical protein
MPSIPMPRGRCDQHLVDQLLHPKWLLAFTVFTQGFAENHSSSSGGPAGLNAVGFCALGHKGAVAR